jgi:hypothetical protein
MANDAATTVRILSMTIPCLRWPSLHLPDRKMPSHLAPPSFSPSGVDRCTVRNALTAAAAQWKSAFTHRATDRFPAGVAQTPPA